MNREQLISYINDPSRMDSESIQKLSELVNEFPYFQTARVLLTLNYRLEKHFRFEEALKTTAVFVKDRSVLRGHINRLSRPARPITLPDEHNEVKPKEVDVVHVTETAKRSENKAESKPSVDELIDKFIKTEPSITRTKATFFSPVEAAKKSIVDEENVVSETLADIYMKQQNYRKAINIYEKLSLKYPEKSTYFAALISKAKAELKK